MADIDKILQKAKQLHELSEQLLQEVLTLKGGVQQATKPHRWMELVEGGQAKAPAAPPPPPQRKEFLVCDKCGQKPVFRGKEAVCVACDHILY